MNGILGQAIKTTIAATKWTELTTLNDAQLEFYKNRVRENINGNDVFAILDVVEISFDPIDKELANKMEAKKRFRNKKNLIN